MSLRRGFTLVELLIVLAILAVVSVVVVPSLSAIPSAQVSMAARDSLRLMRYARNMALQTQRPVTLYFEPGLIRLASDFDTETADVAQDTETPEGAKEKPRVKNALEAGDLETVGLTKRYDAVSFAFVGYDDSVSQGRTVDGTAADFTRRVAGQGEEEEDVSPRRRGEPEPERFAVTVRANGTTRPFTLRVRERDTDRQGDLISFDFLCSGRIGDD